MIMMEQQRVIESKLQQAGLIKEQGRGPIDSAPKDLSNWTTRLVKIFFTEMKTGTMHRNISLKPFQCFLKENFTNTSTTVER